MDPDQVVAHARGMEKALHLRGEDSAPSSELKSRVRAAAAAAGVEAMWHRGIDENGQMVWTAGVRTARGEAWCLPKFLPGEKIDSAWEEAFRDLGVID